MYLLNIKNVNMLFIQKVNYNNLNLKSQPKIQLKENYLPIKC